MPTLIVCGATGRTGSHIAKLGETSGEWEAVIPVNRTHPLEDIIQKGDVLIDFTLPEGCMHHLKLATEHKKPIVIGTTGLSEAQQQSVRAAAETVPVVFAPNMSVGVNVLFKLIQEAAGVLHKGYTVSMKEIHHIHKKDKPSGTAKKMGEVVEAVTGKFPPIESIREGDEPGNHTVTWQSPYEALSINHRAFDRSVFAEGALRAAKWVSDKSPGLYSMQDVLGLE